MNAKKKFSAHTLPTHVHAVPAALAVPAGGERGAREAHSYTWGPHKKHRHTHGAVSFYPSPGPTAFLPWGQQTPCIWGPHKLWGPPTPCRGRQRPPQGAHAGGRSPIQLRHRRASQAWAGAGQGPDPRNADASRSCLGSGRAFGGVDECQHARL